MSELVVFDAMSPRHAFPLLVAGQVQKEFFVNEALARIDALLHPAIEGEVEDPPTEAMPGQCWLAASGATGEWLGREGALATWDGTQWTFCQPVEGMQVHDRSTGRRRVFNGSWNHAERPASPEGGTVADVEARATIQSIIDILATLDLIPSE